MTKPSSVGVLLRERNDGRCFAVLLDGTARAAVFEKRSLHGFAKRDLQQDELEPVDLTELMSDSRPLDGCDGRAFVLKCMLRKHGYRLHLRKRRSRSSLEA